MFEERKKILSIARLWLIFFNHWLEAGGEVKSKKAKKRFGLSGFQTLKSKNFCLLPFDFLLDFLLEAGATFSRERAQRSWRSHLSEARDHLAKGGGGHARKKCTQLFLQPPGKVRSIR